MADIKAHGLAPYSAATCDSSPAAAMRSHYVSFRGQIGKIMHALSAGGKTNPKSVVVERARQIRRKSRSSA
jgi:hypothetical protein